jgi:hypothetical protein
LIGWKGAKDVDEFARTHGGAEGAVVTSEFSHGTDLNFKVTRGEFKARTVLSKQHVGQDGQGVTALHDARDRLQGTQQLFLRCFENNHDVFQCLKVVVVVGRRVGCGKRDFRLFFQGFSENKSLWVRDLCAWVTLGIKRPLDLILWTTVELSLIPPQGCPAWVIL